MKLIVDTDMGFDDVMAIAMLIALDVRLAGITTVNGLAHPDNGRAQSIVFAGTHESSGCTRRHWGRIAAGGANTFPQDWCDDANARSGIDLPPSKQTPQTQSASQFIADTASKHPDDLTILYLGPLTNIALTLQEGGAAFARDVKNIILMGGAVRVPGM